MLSRGKSSNKRRRTKSKHPALTFVGLGLLAVVVAGLVSVALLDNKNEPVAAVPFVAETRTPAPPKVIVTFVGDSFTAGAGSTDPSLRWVTRTASAMKWDEVNLGLGGTGYNSTATAEACGLAYCETYGERIDDVVAANPSIVVVAGGLNDQFSKAAAITEAVGDFYAELRAQLPEAQIVAISPVWRDGNPPPIIADIQTAVRTSATANGAEYLDIGQPLADRTNVLASDGAHPNDAGHGLIADATVAALKAAGFGY
jgi:lysophospholipase L1-like esterase